MQIGKREFDIGKKTFVMGILNVTPDSFFDGNIYNNVDEATKRAKDMIAQGVDIIDIGGESTRPNSQTVQKEQELDRVLPVIQSIRKFSDIPISIDSYKSSVAMQALKVGADMINDIWGLKDDDMLLLAASKDIPCIIMHNQDSHNYVNLISDIQRYFDKRINRAISSGVKRNNIIIDVGIGFAKNKEQNIQVIKNLDKFAVFGLPIMLAASNKSFFGQFGLEVNDRTEATIASSVIATQKGCDFVRVHDVIGNVRALKLADAIFRSK